MEKIILIFGKIIMGTIIIGGIVGVPLYFLGKFIMNGASFLPTTYAGLLRIIESNNHGFWFYLFASILSIWIIYKALAITLYFVSSFCLLPTNKDKLTAIITVGPIICASTLPLIAYFLLSPEITFKTFGNFIGVFEFLIIPVMLTEGFISEVAIVSAICRVLLYGYLIIHFWF